MRTKSSFQFEAFIFFALLVYVLNFANQLFIAALGRSVVTSSLISVSFVIIAALPFLYSFRGRKVFGNFEFAAGFILIVLIFIGILNQNSISNVVLDASTFLLIVSLVRLGADDRYWRFFDRYGAFFFYTAVALVVIGNQYVRLHLSEFSELYSDTDRPVYLLGFEFIRFLEIWPIVFLLAVKSPARRSLRKLIGLLSPLVYLLIMAYFEKRAPIVRCFLYTIGILVAVYGPGFFLRPTFIVLSAIAILSATIFGVFDGTFDAVIARFQQADSSRYEEAMQMLSTLRGVDFLVGRGMGGWFDLGELSSRFVTSVASQNGDEGRVVIHSGLLYPMLKGGLVLQLLFLALFLPAARVAFLVKRTDKFDKALAFIAIVYLVTRLGEGPPTPGTLFEMLVVFAALGRSFNQVHYSGYAKGSALPNSRSSSMEMVSKQR